VAHYLRVSAPPASSKPRRLLVLVAAVALVAVALAGCASSGPAPSRPVVADTGTSAPASAVPAASVDSAVVAGPGTRMVGQALPPGVPEPPAGSDQLVTVLVATPASTSGTLRAWQRAGGGGWTSRLGPVPVKVGTAGVGTAQEGVNRTPRGTFPLAQAFGRQPNPGTALPYRRVGTSDWWVSDPKSPAYNTFRGCAPGTCPFDEGAGENLGQAGASYDYAVVIGYNTDPVRPGAGSAFFVHVDAGVPSAGCVQAPRDTVLSLLRWLNPAERPRITIGLG
jgi:L,D-peptidoglycan transpeptidase YkuD (ErfK/YbiS/YcfS/YnhG family)